MIKESRALLITQRLMQYRPQWPTRVVWSVTCVGVFLAGFAIGINAVFGSCQQAECDEVICFVTDDGTHSSPPTNMGVSYSDTQSQGLLSPGPLGGTSTQHATLQVTRKDHCSYVNGCVGITAVPQEGACGSSCLNPTLGPRWFCAKNGKGVEGSWHEGKTNVQN